MLKGKNLKYPNVIIDKYLRVVNSNSSFHDFFEKEKDWKSKSIHITELVEFDNLILFKEMIKNLGENDKLDNQFRASIKTQKKQVPISIVISISKLDKNYPNWSNQMIQLICTEVEKLADKDEIKYIELKEQLDLSLREISSNLILISQKNQLLESIVKQLNLLLPQANPTIKGGLKKIIANINSQKAFDENWENLKYHYININPSFFKSIRSLSNKITEKDLRHCAYIKMGLSVKETSQLLFLQPKSVEMARYRIKKKLNLKQGQSLSDFIRNI